MQLLVLISLVSCALAAPQGYSAPSISHGGGGGGGGFISGGFSSSSGEFDSHEGGGFISGGGGIGGGYGQSCGNGQIRHVDGSCVQPQVTRNVYVYDAPRLPSHVGPRPRIPRPRVYYNVIFVRTPERPLGSRPIVVPPPQQKTLVYVLSKNGQLGQQVIEVPAGPNQNPEVFYVNYNEGENPTLPGGISLQSALSSAVRQSGQLVGGGGGGGGGFVSSGGFGSGGGGGFISGGSSGGFSSGGFGGGKGGGVIIGGGSHSGEGIGQSYSAPSTSY